MSAVNDEATVGLTTENPNADTIRGLREVADWLEQHPELPFIEFASVMVAGSYALKFPEARKVLGLVAEALGDRAEERSYSDEVQVAGQFATVRVYASAKKRELTPTPPVPPYEPILPRAEQ